jgi:hypothetical protein
MHCTSEQAAELQNELTAPTNWNLHIMKLYTQEEKFAYRYSLSKIAALMEKIMGHAKVCIKKKGHHQGMEFKHPTGANNVISHCAALTTF